MLIEISREEADLLATMSHRILHLNRPVIVRGALQHMGVYDPSTHSTSYSLGQFKTAHHSQRLSVGEIPYWENFYSNGTVMSVGEFIDSMGRKTEREGSPHEVHVGIDGSLSGGTVGHDRPMYAFGSEAVHEWVGADLSVLPPFVKAIANLDLLDQAAIQQSAVSHSAHSSVTFMSIPTSVLLAHHHLQINPQFYLGGPSTGAPWHFHFNAVNALIHGEKQWFLQPPEHAFYSTESPLEWVTRVATKSPEALYGPDHSPPPPMQCTQYSGDVIFAPAGWGHATINAEASIGFAFEISLPQDA